MIDLGSIKFSILIWISLLVGEAHTLLEYTTEKTNWILNDYVPMTIQWNMKYGAGEFQNIIVALAVVFYKDTKFNRTTAKAFVFYYILDLLFYFYNYKRDGYGWTYTLTLIAWILIYNHGNRRISTTDGQRTLIETQR